MIKKIGFASMNIAIIMRMTWTLSADNPNALANSERACENALEREGKFDARGELDSNHPSIHPSSDRGIQRSHQGVIKSMDDCPNEPQK
jgi:hypothetical protein